MTLRVDLNCDLGEGYAHDEELLDGITSANIACGFHAGDPGVMRQTIALAKDKGVAIGAHPGFPDLVGFGRREIDVLHQLSSRIGVTGRSVTFVVPTLATANKVVSTAHRRL